MKEYPLSLVSDYRSHWSVADAIREILQNALDDISSFEYGFPGDSIIIRNKGVTLDPSSLLLGTTTKGGDSNVVGGFGEGFKIALLILCREGYKVTVRNGECLWIPEFKYSSLFKCEMLHITETPLEDNEDLTFIIEGVDEDLKNIVIERCLYLQRDLGENVIETSMGRIFKDTPGKLYVGGLFVTNTDLKHSYDFHPNYLQLNTDRQSINTWDLKSSTAKMWGFVNDPNYVAEMINDSYPDTQHVEYYCNKDIRSSCFNLYKERYNSVPIASNTDEKDTMVSKGYKNVEVTGNTVFNTLVKESSEYRLLEDEWNNEGEIDERGPLEILKEWCCLQQSSIEGFNEIIEIFEKRGIIWDE